MCRFSPLPPCAVWCVPFSGAVARRIYSNYKRKKMDVIKREEAKRVASGRGHFRPTSDELGLRVCTK